MDNINLCQQEKNTFQKNDQKKTTGKMTHFNSVKNKMNGNCVILSFSE